jgi:glycosyltransferase involved in cell wall biosynthesis
MPVYNGARYIAEAIESVLKQTFTSFELLIINDGSTDNTEEIIRSFTDLRIVLVNETHKGIASALNTGLNKANGKYIARFDADDICFPQRLEKQVYFLDNNDEYIVTGSDAEYISAEGEHLFDFKCNGHTGAKIRQHLPEHCPFIHSAVLYRRESVLACGGYSVNAHNLEDHLLWIQLSKAGKFFNIPEPLVKVRINPASVTIDERWRGRRFRNLKSKILERGTLTKAEGEELLFVIKKQNTEKIKKGSYYALCGKKFLINNYQPLKSRKHIRKAIVINPLRLDSYVLLLASYLPFKWIQKLHKKVNI